MLEVGGHLKAKNSLLIDCALHWSYMACWTLIGNLGGVLNLFEGEREQKFSQDGGE